MPEALVLLATVALTAGVTYRLGLRRARPKVILFEPFRLYHHEGHLIAEVRVLEVTRSDLLGEGRIHFSGQDTASLTRETTYPPENRG